MIIKVFVGNNINRKAVMVDSAETLKKVLGDNQIDYSIGMTTLDGATLGAGELDKTFDEFGIKDTCYLLNTAKAVNATGIKVVGNRAFIESDFSHDELKEVIKYRPEAVNLVDPETKEVTFTVKVGAGDGSISKYGAQYGSGATADHKALISIQIPDGADAKEFIEETVGVAILLLQKVESTLGGKLEEIAAEKAAVLGAIEVL